MCIHDHADVYSLDMESTTTHDAGMAPNDRQISVRLPLETLARCDALQSALEQHPKLGAFQLSRNGVIKLLLNAGLEALEAEYDVKGADDGNAS